ncbi:MAG: hypothetical protein WD875_16735 [Pirellulales bacterium]
MPTTTTPTIRPIDFVGRRFFGRHGVAAFFAVSAGEKPELVESMAAKWQAWADRVGVQPWPVQVKREN